MVYSSYCCEASNYARRVDLEFSAILLSLFALPSSKNRLTWSHAYGKWRARCSRVKTYAGVLNARRILWDTLDGLARAHCPCRNRGARNEEAWLYLSRLCAAFLWSMARVSLLTLLPSQRLLLTP
jgi:hypothetical protein